KERHVGIWLWKHSKELRDPAARRSFFKRCHDLGVAGVKVDFFDHEAKEVIDFYHALLREAAENRLLVNFHGANKPAGEARTWPQLMKAIPAAWDETVVLPLSEIGEVAAFARRSSDA